MAGQLVFPFAQPSRSAVIGTAVRARRDRKSVPRSSPPRISQAAVRVPDPRHLSEEIQFPPGQPQIFVHEGARQALARRLELAHQRPVLLSVTDNYRQMLSSSLHEGVLRARVHHMFLDAPASVQEALVRYMVNQERDASLIVGQYIDQNGHRIRASRPVSTPLVTQGRTHDLLALFRKLNHQYFGDTVDALITWGRRVRVRRPRRTIKLGSYSAIERLIRIHPVLDQPWVPRYFVSYIVYHEMLHHVIPASRGVSRDGSGSGRRLSGGRRTQHPPEFVARERVFRYYDRAIAWEKAHVGRLLRAS